MGFCEFGFWFFGPFSVIGDALFFIFASFLTIARIIKGYNRVNRVLCRER